MDQQWSPYTEGAAASRQPRYAPLAMTTPQHAPRDPNGAHQIKQDPYASPPAPSRTGSVLLTSPGGQPGRGADYNDGDGDVRMEDADPYNKPKQASARASQQQRQSQQFIQQEESAAARRYSPMNLSPTSPYNGATQQGGQAYTSFTPQAQGSRQSPTRNNPYMSPPNSYYSPPSKFHPRRRPSRLSARILISRCCSLPSPCATTPSSAIYNESRELLSAIRYRTAQRRLQSRRSLAAVDKP
jgi:dual specificity protein kinase YAK1